MKSNHALILSLLLTGLIASNVFIFHELSKPEAEIITILRVIDGDTIVDSQNRTIRLLNINTPEKSETFSKESTDFMKSFQDQKLKIEITGQDKYKRYLARLHTLNNNYLNLLIVEEGLAKPFLVQDSESNLFQNSLQQAIKQEKGQWEHSVYYNCFNSKILKKDEIIKLSVTCPDIATTGFKITDESRKQYFITTNHKNFFNIHSGNGEDNSTDLYWGSSTNVWNNDRDTLYVFDSEDKIIHHNSYGY
jgi:micrococcal nuclease